MQLFVFLHLKANALAALFPPRYKQDFYFFFFPPNYLTDQKGSNNPVAYGNDEGFYDSAMNIPKHL